MTGDIDMNLHNIKNLGTEGFSFNAGALLLTFTGITPTIVQPSGSLYTYFVCKTGCGIQSPTNTLTNVTYFAVGGGGGGGANVNGGGGAGGLRTNDPSISSGSLPFYSNQFDGSGLLSLSSGVTYTVGVGTGGAGGSPNNNRGTNGTDTTFKQGGISVIPSAATGGGGGGAYNSTAGGNGGCGGGAGWNGGSIGTGSQGGNGSLQYDSGYLGGGGGGIGCLLYTSPSPRD